MNKKQLQDYLNMEMVKVLCELEIKIYQARCDRMDNKISRYFNSTPAKNTFARFVVNSYIVNKPYSIQHIADELRMTRQSVSKMVEECEAEGWVKVKRTANRTEFLGTKAVYDNMLDYLEYRKKLAKNTTKGRWNDLTRLADMVENDFTLYPPLSDNPVDVDENKKIINLKSNWSTK